MELKPDPTPGVDSGIDDVAGNAGAVAQESRSMSTGPAVMPGAFPAGATQLLPVDGVVRLPAGTRLDAIRISGPNLVVTLPDGQVFVIVDGALHPPQIVLGTISISAANIAALIAGQEPEPAAGAPQSSGGNFIETPGDIGDPFGLGDLLPPTEFGFARSEEEETIPSIDNDPEISIVTPDQPLGATTATATVSEAALAARRGEPAGSDPSSTAETVSGTISINSPDRPNVVAVNGTAITAVGQTVTTPLGVITITSIAADAIGYTYTLLDNSTDPASSETVTITVTDRDGDVATATLTLAITDDVPTARDDIDDIAPNTFAAQIGNVISGLGTTSGAAGADTPGADGVTVTGFRHASASAFTAAGTVIQGQYGTLLMLPNGAYSYVRNPGTAGGVADIFTYQLTDGDGDTSTATLTYNIGDSTVGLVVPSAGDEGTVVDEAGLSERNGEAAGSRDGDGSTLTFGAITFNAPDGPAIITINGVKVTGVDQEIELPTGTLFIVAIDKNSIQYAFLLKDNVTGGASTQPVDVTVTDQDGDSASASFVIDILDDVPTAVADTHLLAVDNFGPATGNVITDVENDGGRDIQGADGATVSVVVGAGGSVAAGTAVAGLYGTLTLNSDGSYSYVRNAGSPGNVSDVFTYTLSDGDGDTSTATLTISIPRNNFAPVAQADSNWVLDGTSGSDPSAVGNVLQDVGHPGAPSGSFADRADNDPDLDPITVTSAGTFVGLYGTLVIAANGAYSYTLNEDNVAVNALDAGQTLVESFGYTVSDGLLAVNSTLTITVFGTNDAPTVGTTIARISEENLPGGIADNAPDATLDTTNSVSFGGTLAIGDPDAGETLTATLGDPGAVLTAGGVPVTWAGVGTGTLIGSAGGNEVIRVTLAPNGAYTVTLSRAVDHPVIALEDLKEFTVPVSVSDGTVTTTNASAIRIIIEDDAPTATGETDSRTQVEQDVNALFILDFSGSIDDGELDVMLDAVKNALTQLDASAVSALAIKFVIFSSGSFASPSFGTAAEANAYLDTLNPADGGTRPDTIGLNTNYTSAINTALANFLAVPGASNQVFFLSDGNPNQAVQFSPPDPPNLPTVVNSLQNATATAWNNFVDGNNVNVTAIGIDNDPLQPLNIQRLRDVDLNDAPDNEPILVADFDDLVAALLSVVVPAMSGDLDANDAYGADGGRMLSITIDTVTYTWDGTSSIAISSGGTIAGNVLTATTPMGGTLQLDFATGQYNYRPPSPITVTTTEVFSYTIVDKDGDTASADLSVTISALAPPVVLDLDGDGVEFLSSAAGVLFDYNGDGVAESTAWVGADDGLLVLDKNGDGIVNDGSEIIFAHGNLTDLQGLAASYDSNKDGKLDQADAAFAKFGVWRDANSNGATDAGEFTSLSQAGIASISLVSDGRAYTAANGEVIVRGEGTFTRSNGSAGVLADAAFATNFANGPKRGLQVSETSGLATALVVAGLVATLPLAAEDGGTLLLDDQFLADGNDDTAGRMIEPSTVERAEDPELWLNQAAEPASAQPGNAPASQRFLDEGDHSYMGGAPDMVAVTALLENTTLAEPGVGALHQQQSAPSVDQVMLQPVAVQDNGALTVDEINVVVADAIEGRTIDLDALLAAYVGSDQKLPELLLQNGSPQGFFADYAMSASGDILLTNMAEQQVMAQMEQAATSGHA